MTGNAQPTAAPPSTVQSIVIDFSIKSGLVPSHSHLHEPSWSHGIAGLGAGSSPGASSRC